MNNLVVKSKRHKNNTIIMGTFFLLPALAFIFFSIYIPTIWNFILSFQEWDGFLKRKWVLFDNYIKAFQDPLFLKSLYNSIFLAIITSILAIAIGVFLAVMIYRLGKMEGSIFRLIIFIPVMLPTAIVGLLFSFIFNPEMGLLNQLLNVVGLGTLTTAWLENIDTVKLCISFVGIWKIAGLTMMLCFAAMQLIPSSLFESSKIDGANYFIQFKKIIFPLIKPIIQLSVVYTLVINFKMFDLVYVLTGGGPGTATKIIPLLMIDTAFNYNEFGYSSAMGFILTIAVMLIIFITNKVFNGEHYEY